MKIQFNAIKVNRGQVQSVLTKLLYTFANVHSSAAVCEMNLTNDHPSAVVCDISQIFTALKLFGNVLPHWVPAATVSLFALLHFCCILLYALYSCTVRSKLHTAQHSAQHSTLCPAQHSAQHYALLSTLLSALHSVSAVPHSALHTVLCPQVFVF